MSVNEQDALRRAEDLFVARATVDDATPNPRRLAFADLYAFLTNPTSELSIDHQRQLFSDPRLRADFQRLKQELIAVGGGIDLPRVAAASDGELSERPFPGGAVKIAAS